MGAAQCLILEHESLESHEIFSSRRFSFPTDYTDFHRFLTPRGVFAVSLSEYRCLQRRESVQICEICGRLFLNHNAKIQHFIFPTHRCSLLLTDTHRLSLINIRVLPNGRKYRILAADWTPCSSCCIHSSAAAHRAGCILLSISSDGLLPRPGRNPENRAGLTPAWCNFVNPFSCNVEFSHRSHRFSQIFDSFGVFAVSLSESTVACNKIICVNLWDLWETKNNVECYLLGLCFVNMILSHRNHDT